MPTSRKRTAARKAPAKPKPQRDEIERLAHELRGSLASLRNVVHLFESPEVEWEKVVRARDIMNRQILSMAGTIDDLLAVARGD